MTYILIGLLVVVFTLASLVRAGKEVHQACLDVVVAYMAYTESRTLVFPAFVKIMANRYGINIEQCDKIIKFATNTDKLKWDRVNSCYYYLENQK